MTGTPDVSDYCRAIETYLCQKNEGHLIRIVGPAFEQVSGWAARGVPLKVAFRGIDRYCERYYAKGPRRRPVRIEFCEADILDTFDDWRRAIGVASNGGTEEAPDRKGSLASHLDRVIARLTGLRGGGATSPDFANQLEAVARELDPLRTEAQRARGDRRAEIIAALERMDRDLLSAAAGAVEPERLASLRREAREELTPFASRMSPDAHAAALDAAFARLLRDVIGLPIVRYE